MIEKIPLCEKVTLTIEEAAEYSNIGQNRISSSIKDTKMSVCALRWQKKLSKEKRI